MSSLNVRCKNNKTITPYRKFGCERENKILETICNIYRNLDKDETLNIQININDIIHSISIVPISHLVIKKSLTRRPKKKYVYTYDLWYFIDKLNILHKQHLSFSEIEYELIKLIQELKIIENSTAKIKTFSTLNKLTFVNGKWVNDS